MSRNRVFRPLVTLYLGLSLVTLVQAGSSTDTARTIVSDSSDADSSAAAQAAPRQSRGGRVNATRPMSPEVITGRWSAA